jgi:hypothetical protein
VNYGYSQVSSGSAGTTDASGVSNEDIVIIDGDSTSTTDDGEEDWADESLYYQGTDQADFPITSTDEWSGQASDAQVQIIY